MKKSLFLCLNLFLWGNFLYAQFPLEEKDMSGDPLVTGQSSGFFDSSSGFDPQQGYTVEIKAKAGTGEASSLEIFGGTGIGKGFKFSVADSAVMWENPALTPYPYVVKERKNADRSHIFRFAVTPDDTVYAYRNGILIDKYDMHESVLPAEMVSGQGEVVENLLVNPGFEGNVIREKGEDATAGDLVVKMDGWIVHPFDEWNSHVYVEPDPGNQVVMIERYDWNAGWTDATLTQVVNVVPGETYSFGCMAKGGIHEGMNYGYFRLEEVQNTKKFKQEPIKTEDFEKYEFDYTASAECRQLRVILGLKSPGAIGEWGSVPKVPIWIDDVVLQGKSVSYYPKATGYNSISGAAVDYFTYDLTGAFAPVEPKIITDKNRVTIGENESFVNLEVSGKGLRPDENIRIIAPQGFSVTPAEIPYNSDKKQVMIMLTGTKLLTTGELVLRSGETRTTVELAGKRPPMEVRSLAENPQSRGEHSFVIDENAGFTPGKNGYTAEIKVKVKEGTEGAVRVHAATRDGKGFRFLIGDSLLTIMNPKSQENDPAVILGRRNAGKFHTFRFAVTSDNLIYVYRDGNPVDTLHMSDYLMPSDLIASSEPGYENLLQNADFDGEYKETVVESTKKMVSEIEAWDVFPLDEWNTRQYIDTLVVDEATDIDNRGLVLERYDWNKGWTDGRISQAVNIVPNTEYTLSVLAKGGIHEGVRYGYIRMEEVENPTRGKNLEIASEAIETHTLRYTPSATCKQMRVVFGLKSPGAIGSWGATPKVPISVDRPLLTGKKVLGAQQIGFTADDNVEVDYFAYNAEKAYAPVTPSIGVEVTSGVPVAINGTRKSAVLIVTGNHLVPGEDIKISVPEGFTAKPDVIPYDASKKAVVVTLNSTASAVAGQIRLKSGSTKTYLDITGYGSPLEQKDLSAAPLYTGTAEEWSVTKAQGFAPGKNGYSVEFKIRNEVRNSLMTLYGIEESGRGYRMFVDHKSIGVYNGSEQHMLRKLTTTDDTYTYRYAVTSDNQVFIYRNGIPMDTVRLQDYTLPDSYAVADGEYTYNLLNNPGFEGKYTTYVMPDDPDKGEFVNYIEGWQIYPVDGWNARQFIGNCEIDETYDEDNHALGLERYLWEDGWNDGTIYQIVDVAPNSTYSLSAVAKGGIREDNDKPLGYIAMEEVLNPELGNSVPVTSEDFDTYMISYTTSKNCKQLKITLGVHKGSKSAKMSRMWVDNVVLSGMSRTYDQKLGFSKQNANLEYFTYDMTGAYAPVMATFDVSEQQLVFGQTLEKKTLTVSSRNLRSGEPVTISVPAGFKAEPDRLEPNAENQEVIVTFLGSSDRSGSLLLKCGELEKAIYMKGTASALPEKDLSENPVYTGTEGSYELSEADGFQVTESGYTLEIKGKFRENGGGYFEIGSAQDQDHGITFAVTEDFMAAGYEVGTIDMFREEKNTGDITYRFAITPDNMAFVYKDSVTVDTLNLRDYPVNTRFMTGQSEHSDNLVVNGNFNGIYEYTQYEEARMLSYLEGWRLTGIDEWNARAYIEGDAEEEGNHVLTLERYDWNAGWADGVASQVVNVVPNSTYSIKALVKGGLESGLNLAYMEVKEVGGSGSKRINISGSNTYTEKTVSMTTSADCRQLVVNFGLSASGQKPGPKCKTYIKNVTVTGEKPLYAPALYLSAEGEFDMEYFTYDLTGAYAPVGNGTGIRENILEDSPSMTGYVRNGFLYLNQVPEMSVIRVFDSMGTPVYRSSGDVASEGILLPEKGMYIILAVSDSGRQVVKVIY